MTTIKPELLSVASAAAYVGVSKVTVYNWIDEGLPIEYQGRVMRIRRTTLDKWLGEQRARA